MTELGINASKTLLKGAALLSAGQVASYSLSFVRNLILARLLTKADFGLAAALAMTISLLELVSRMAFGIQIIQAKNGNDPRFQAVAHAVQMMFGLVSALIVALGAYPMAKAFSVPELTWAFALLALVPLARGSMHLDNSRMQRHMNYRPYVIMEAVTQGIATAASWPFAIWLGDYRAVLWIMLGKEMLTVAMSHLLSVRPYQWAWDANQVRQMIVFGVPLLLNGLVIFASQQGDQMLVGATFSLVELAPYSIAFALTSIPAFIFSQVGSSLMLPFLSRNQENPLQFELHYQRCLEIAAVASLIFLGPMVIAGGDIVRLLYGQKYTDVGGLMAVFAASAALRFFRWAPAVAAMAKADTINQLIGNVVRSFSLLFALTAVFLGMRNLIAVAACGLVGEALVIIVTMYLIKVRQGIKATVHARPLLFLVMWVLTGLAIYQSLADTSPIWIVGLVTVIFCFSGFFVALLIFRNLTAACRQIIDAVFFVKLEKAE